MFKGTAHTVKWLVWVHIIIMVLCYNMYPFLSEETYHFYFKGVSIAWLLPAVAILKLTYKSKARCAGIAIVGLAFNNVLDEFFFDPSRIQLNEILIAIVIIFWIVKDAYD